MDKINFGTFYVAGVPEHPVCCPDLRLSGSYNVALGNTMKGFEMSWMKLGNIFVGTKCACTGISWNDLNERGYIFGYQVQIDGRFYHDRRKTPAFRHGDIRWQGAFEDTPPADGI